MNKNLHVITYNNEDRFIVKKLKDLSEGDYFIMDKGDNSYACQ